MEIGQFDLYSRRIQSHHALFIFDACFAGTLFTGKVIPEPLTRKALEPVRQFITSGSADEQVPDKSIFRAQLIRALEGEADHNGDGYITGTELGLFLQQYVMNYSRNTQHPQYGKIRNPNLDKGELLFVVPGSETILLPGSASEPASFPDEIPSADKYESQQTGIHLQTGNNHKPTAASTGTGDLKVTSTATGDLYIGNTFYRTIEANTVVLLFNLPAGRHNVELRGEHPWASELEIKNSETTIVSIQPAK